MECPGTWAPLNLPMDLIQCQIVHNRKADKNSTEVKNSFLFFPTSSSCHHSCLKRLYLIIGDELASSYNKNNHIYADGFSFKKINIIEKKKKKNPCKF
jgi:hypothetical protein